MNYYLIYKSTFHLYFFKVKRAIGFTLILLITFVHTAFSQTNKTAEFVTIQKYIPSVKIEMRYYSNHNFIGKKIDGYNSDKAIISIQAATALKKIQRELNKKGLSLIIYDAYRPQKAVNHFKKWAKVLNDTLAKKEFYPNVAKKDLFSSGYISSHSRHSSGSTVDLSIISLATNKALDMGSPYDYFGKQSWVNYSKLTKIQKNNRQLLQNIMLQNGFRNYPKEWWHFTLRNEPYKNVYFDFNVE